MSDTPEDLVAEVTFDAGLPTQISRYLGTQFNEVFTERLNEELGALKGSLVKRSALKDAAYLDDVRYQFSLFVFRTYILAADVISTLQPTAWDEDYYALRRAFDRRIMTRGWVSLEDQTPVIHVHFVKSPDNSLPENVNAYLLNTTPTLMRLN